MNGPLATLDRGRLEAALRRAGLLGGATVRDLVVDGTQTTVLSRITRLRVAYTAQAQGAPERFFDWDSWRVDVGASDLAYMMAVHWYPDRRHRCEAHLLDCYHDALRAAGVRGYDRAALDADYRFATLWMLTWPVWQEAYGVPPVYWWNNLERVWLAVDDLGCRDLL